MAPLPNSSSRSHAREEKARGLDRSACWKSGSEGVGGSFMLCSAPRASHALIPASVPPEGVGTKSAGQGLELCMTHAGMFLRARACTRACGHLRADTSAGGPAGKRGGKRRTGCQQSALIPRLPRIHGLIGNKMHSWFRGEQEGTAHCRHAGMPGYQPVQAQS